MNTAGRIIKYLGLALALFLIYSIFRFGLMLAGYVVNGFDIDMTLDNKIIELEKNPDNYILELIVGAAEVEIIEGDTFNVEADTKYFEVVHNVNIYKVVELKHHFNFTKKNKVVVTIPKNTKFAGIEINGGAGKIKTCDLVADNVVIKTGVGKVTIDSLTSFEYTSIESGVGEFTIKGGSLRDADIEFGVGKVSLKSKLLGKSKIESGIGQDNIVLIGEEDDYRISVEKGLGSININNKSVANETVYGSGNNYVDISGGIGEINIKFE